MPMKIVILEDDKRRAEAMRGRLADRFYQFEHVFFDSAAEVKEYLEHHFGKTGNGDGTGNEQNTGR